MSDASGSDQGGPDPAPDPSGGSLRRRVVEQFSGVGERAAVWHGLERFLPTAEYLNLGYSPRFVPTLAGDSQARLAARLADGLAGRVDDPAGAPLLDLGCGRGGPARQFAERGFVVTGLDLVPHNVSLARANARGAGESSEAGDGNRTRDGAVGSDESGRAAVRDRRRPRFLVGDATALPFEDGAFAACAAVDSLVYLPDEADAFAEVARVVRDGGWLASADLLAADDPPPGADEALSAFADAWDVAPVGSVGAYREQLRAAGLSVERVEDVTPNSVGRFRRWSRTFLALADGPTGGPLRGLLRGWGVPPDTAVSQVRAAHRALPYLRHVIVYARS